MSRILTTEEKDEMVMEMKNGDFSKFGILIEFVTPYMSKKYRDTFEPSDGIEFDDFRQMCSMEIHKSIPGLQGSNYGELYNYATKIIDIKAAGILRKHIRNKNRRVIVENVETTYYYAKNTRLNNFDEDEILNNILQAECYKKFIKGNVPKQQLRAVNIFYTQKGDLKEYLLKVGIKPDTFRKNLNRGMNRIREIIATEEFRKYYSAYMLPLLILSRLIFDEDVFLIY